jgi:hypothetical protein
MISWRPIRTAGSPPEPRAGPVAGMLGRVAGWPLTDSPTNGLRSVVGSSCIRGGIGSTACVRSDCCIARGLNGGGFFGRHPPLNSAATADAAAAATSEREGEHEKGR